ncbi:TPA: phosphoglycerate kinase [Candidatus Bathyarchaeota archaeon]|nr:phosphoglycerate kinase [Candidatus Bathyarchaeota archaeon]
MPERFRTLNDVDVRGKRVLVRVDLNVPYDAGTGKIADSDRVREHAKTLRELSDRGARVVVLAHQGRKGGPDFIPLRQHAELLGKHVGKRVEYVSDTIGDRAKARIRSLRDGDIILLENVRFLDDETLSLPPEEHARSSIVRELAPLVDIFVNDAFSVAHRSHASTVGFTAVLPSVAGRVMESEVRSIERLLSARLPITFILGGAKVDDCLAIMDRAFGRGIVEAVLTGGILSQLFLMARGCRLGKTTGFLERKGFLKLLPQVRGLYDEHGDRIVLPVDVAVELDGKRREVGVDELPIDALIMDIGSRTAGRYAEIIKDAAMIVFKGPLGVYEREGFGEGTRIVLDAVASSSAFSLVGGGDTLSALERIGVDKNRFSHVSLGGGALVVYLSGKPMPAIEALRKGCKGAF